jgi:hypothetical protein
MGTESQAEQIMAKIVTELEAIVGDNGTTAWYTADKVSRVRYWDARFLGAEYDVLYLVRQNRNREVAAAFGEGMEELELSILCAQQDKAAEQNPHKRTVSEDTLQNRHVQDARDKLESDRSLGGLAMTLRIPEVDYDMGPPDPWIASEIFVVVQYDYTTGAS